MAIQIGANDVIDDDRKLVNITGATGKYDNFQPNVTTGTLPGSGSYSHPMSTPFTLLTMSRAETISITGSALGRCSIIQLDTSASLYAPNFTVAASGGEVQWQDDAVPDWDSRRFWTVALVGWSSSIVRATATGYDVQDPGTSIPTSAPWIKLSGTSNSPNYDNSFAITDNFTDVSAGWKFKTDGTLECTILNGQAFGRTSTPAWDGSDEWYDSTEAGSETPGQGYWIRASETSSGPQSSLATGSAPLDQWLPLKNASGSVDRTWSITNNQVGLTNIKYSYLKMEIALDAAGSNIVATGYYFSVAHLQEEEGPPVSP
jgi:hypothetical protein